MVVVMNRQMVVGTHEASKANLLQIPAALAGAVVGNGGMLAQLAQMGIGLGTQSLLLKYSRGAEHDADINGTRMMQDAGYDPAAMAHMFEKLEKLGGGAKTSDWLSDHPSPGNRVQYVDEEVKHLPVAKYSEMEPATLASAKTIVARLPDPPKAAQPVQTAASVGPGAPAVVRPSGRTLQYQSNAFTVSYPDNWQTFGEQGGSAVTIAPKEALISGLQTTHSS